MDSIIFQKPVRTSASNGGESFFVFNITAVEPLFINEFNNKIVLPANIEIAFLTKFLESAKSFFVKPPTVKDIRQRLEHIASQPSLLTDKHSINYNFTPKKIFVYTRRFVIEWEASPEPMIDFVDFHINTDKITSGRQSRLDSEEESTSIPDLPISDTTDPPLRLAPEEEEENDEDEDDTEYSTTNSDERVYRLRVMEAQLNAKLALYEARRAAARYERRFGELLSDNESDSEGDSEGDSDVNVEPPKGAKTHGSVRK